jgi:two-component system sensor histidine kinase HydH
LETQSAFMAAAAAAVLLVAALFRRRDPAHLRFVALTLAFVAWSLGRGAGALGVGWGGALSIAGLALLGPASLAFAAEFAGSRPAPRALRVALFGGAFALAAAAVAPARPVWLGTLAVGWACAGLLTGGALLWRSRAHRHDPGSPDATRLRYLAVIHTGVLVSVAADVVLWGWRISPVASLLGGAVYLYAGWLLISRVRIADLRQLMGSALGLALLAAGLVGVFSALRIWVGPRLDLFVFNAFVASFALLLVFPPVRDRIQHAMDRRFVAGRLELERSLLPLRERLPQILTLDELLRELLATLERSDRVTASGIFLRENPHLGFQQAASIGLSPRPRVNLVREPHFVEALAQGEPLMLEELEKARAGAGERDERVEVLCRVLADLDAQLLLPLRSGSYLLGFWTLTDSSSREPFSTPEVELLRSVAEQAAISVENSKTFERIRARDRLVDLGEMAAGLAHEVRNPLAAIRGGLALLEDSGSEEGARAEISDVIVEEIHRLDRVVGTFLDYARPSVHRVLIPDASRFVRDCVNSIARRHAKEDVELYLDVEPGLCGFTADRDRLETVIGNAVQNAYEALDGKGSIRVTVRPVADPVRGPCVEIAVQDDGPGMDEETLERAFVPFYTTKHGGMGLGLALCERLTRAQGGAIEIRSRPGEGTTLTVCLPVEPIEEAEA